MAILGTPTLQAEAGSYTAEAGADRICSFLISTDCNATGITITGFQFGGVACTEAIQINSDSELAAIFYIKEANIPVGSNSFSITYSGGTPDAAKIGCYTLSGRDQASAVSATLSEGSSTNPYTLTLAGVSSGDDCLAVLCGATPSRTISGVTGGFTLDVTENSGTYGTNNLSAQSVTAGSLTSDITWSSSNVWATAAASFKAAAPSNTTINVDIPLHINLKWDTTHQLAVTHDGGTTTLDGVTLSTPTGWETVSFSTIPDTGTTESFYEYSQSDVTVGNFTAQVGDTLAFTSSTGLTIDGSSIPVVDPAATVTGSYKWWDASLSTWTPVSSYTITNLGVFGGSDTTVMIQEMISDMISEMVN